MSQTNSSARVKEEVDNFYSESNMNYIEKIIKNIEKGKSKLVEHELIEDYE